MAIRYEICLGHVEMKAILVENKIIGHFARLHDVDYFFGTRFGTQEIVEKHFGLKIQFLKQSHGNKIVKADGNMHEADAHWTDFTGQAIGIYTADCIPLLLSCSATHRVFAVHCGWRGVRNQIAARVSHFLRETNSTSKSLQLAIGPHIGPKSFEIEKHLAEEILATDPKKSIKALPHTNTEKVFVPLAEVVKNQIGDVENILSWTEDTFTNALYYSYRRDKASREPQKNRLISFIIRK